MNRLATGVPELDVVLGGGLLAGSFVVVAGDPGTGKTILAQQLCFAAATAQRKVWQCEVGEKGLSVSAQLKGVSGALGWSALRGDPAGDSMN